MSAPARRYSWPPFEPGNLVSLKHGAESPRLVQPMADDAERWLREQSPLAGQPLFAPTVSAWAYAEAQCQLVRQYLDQHGVLDDQGEPRPSVAFLERIEKRAANLRGELGLSPTAWARLAVLLASAPGVQEAGIEALRSVGRDLLAGQQTGTEAAT